MALPNPRFDASYERLFGDGVSLAGSSHAFFERFYERFLQDPGIAKLFESTDLEAQVRMLKISMVSLVSYYVVGHPTPELTRLARLHNSLGVTSDLFDRWLDTLLQTVEEFDAECDEATLLAWCWAVTPGITYMRMYQDVEGDTQ